jgi:hypothetical protein
MRVIRDERTGQVLVEVGGQRYAHLREIDDAQVGRRILWAIADLLRFTGGMAANPQAVRNAAQQMAQDEHIFAQGAAPAPGTSSAQEPLQTTPTTGSRYSMVEFFRRGLEAPPIAPLPRPVPLPYAVHVVTGPDERLQIHVGQDVYGSSDEVPDLEARELIQAAVKEWEER